MFPTPEDAASAFYQAFQQANIAKMMRVWADDEDIACIHSGGARVVGHEAVKAAWQDVFVRGAMRIVTSRPMIMTTVMSSVHVLIEQLTITTPGGTSVLYCHTTNIFHKGRTGWRMVHHHASRAPENTRMFDLQDIPDMLH